MLTIIVVSAPWCGKEFPKDLTKEFFDLANDLDVDVWMINKEDWPEELKSDEWWKKRKL